MFVLAKKSKLPKKTYSLDRMRFNWGEFVDYYNSLTEEQWQEVIQIFLDKSEDYDIRCVIPYKQKFGEDFNVFDIDEVMWALLKYDHLDTRLYDRSDYIDYEEACEYVKREITEIYSEFGLPVPAFWRNRLWK